LGPGLVGDELHAEDLLGRLGRGLAPLRHLDAAALTATAGVDLRLHHHRLVARLVDQPLGGLVRLGEREGHLALRDRNAVAPEQLLGLVLVDLQRTSSYNFLAASMSSRTAAADLSRFAFSSGVSDTVTIRSMPRAPITTGTPMY